MRWVCSSSHRAFPRTRSFAQKLSWFPGHLPMSFEMLLRMFMSTQSCKSQLSLFRMNHWTNLWLWKRKQRKRSSRSGIGVDQSSSVQTTKLVELLYVISWIPDFSSRILAKRLSRSCTVLVTASCFRELILSYDYVGTVIPASSSHDTVCKWCAKKANISGDMDSSVSNTSSSTEDEK